jgi:hypothetical protein
MGVRIQGFTLKLLVWPGISCTGGNASGGIVGTYPVGLSFLSASDSEGIISPEVFNGFFQKQYILLEMT